MSAGPERKDYIRVKRRNQTFFIHTSPSDTFFYIKSEISKAMGCCISDDDDDTNDAISPRKMRLYLAPSKNSNTANKDDGEGEDDNSPKGPIPDSAMLSDHDVKNDDILFVTFLKEGKDAGGDIPEEDDAWEEIEVS